MGKVNIGPKPQQDGSYQIEIIYGGVESPFGGIDNSAPPAYIDPSCFADSDGFLVINNKLVLNSLQQIATPTLWSGVAGVKLIGFGTFFNSTYGQLNYALGYTYNEIGTPSGVNYEFYITSWDPSNIATVYNDYLPITLFDTYLSPVAASIALDAISSNSLPGSDGTGATMNITSVGGAGQILAYTLSGGAVYTVGTLLQVVQGSVDTAFVIVDSVDGSGAILTSHIESGTNTGYATGAATPTLFPVSSTVLLLSQANLVANITSVNGVGGITGMTISGGFGFVVGSIVQIEILQRRISPLTGDPATITVTSVDSNGAITGFTFTAGVNYVTGPAFIGYETSIPSWVIAGDYKSLVTDMVSNWNGDVPTGTVVASASTDGYQLILTAATPGAQGNMWTVQDFSYNQNNTLAPPLYFSPGSARPLEGGQDKSQVLIERNIVQASICSVGGTLYIGNIGPMILQYAGPGTFTTNTMYTGVNVLRKFAGSLVGLGVVPQAGVFTQDTDMIFVWSSAEELSEWAPETTAGDVTGAGFAQLADIADSLTGMIVANNTAFIIRQEGVSYATALSNGIDPYDFAHISLGDSGEGGQIPQLVVQYDQMGVFVGNTNIFSVSNGLVPIGQKIKAAFFQFLSSLPDPIPAAVADAYLYVMSSAACGISSGETSDVHFAFMLSNNIYFFNATTGVWTKCSYTQPVAPLVINNAILGVFGSSSLLSLNQGFSQSTLTLAEGLYNTSTDTLAPPVFYALRENSGVALSSSISSQPYIVFPVEQISFGRDIVIDALLVEIALLNIPTGASLSCVFFINGIEFGTLPLAAGESAGTFQVFPSPGVSTFAAKDPQLQVQIIRDSLSTVLEFSKIAIFGAFDPSQRPV